ncbi:beta-lactamase/transpeptidase-like protein [Atractiella rhizophila]|nr:beta-lactamase/transpeptidase-like protein [Atractiella rhizophila]
MTQLFLPLLCLVSSGYGAQFPFKASSKPTLINQELRSFVEAIQNLTGLPGVGLGVVKLVNGSWVEESAGFGKASDVEGHVVDGNTLFNIGSNSKAFTALAYSFLQHEDGTEFSYREKVKDLLPDWSLVDPVAERQASVLDILSHRHGVPRHDLAYSHEDDFASNQHKLGALYPSAEFREHWQYNNMMYVTAGRIIALHSSHTPLHPLNSSKSMGDDAYQSFIHSHIFTPLHMEHTSFSPDLYPDRMAKGYMLLSNRTSFEIPYVPETESGKRYIAPAGGIISSPNDLNIWTKFLVDSARKAEGWSYTSEADFLRPEAVKEMVSGHMVGNSRAVNPYASSEIYGMALSRRHYRGKDLVWHGGAVDGFGSQIAWSPMEGVGIAVLTNNMGVGNLVANLITLRAFEELVGLEPLIKLSEFEAASGNQLAQISSAYPISSMTGPAPYLPAPCQKKSPTPKVTATWTGPSLPLSAFEGVYESQGYGTAHLCLAKPHHSALSACNDLYSHRENSTLIVDPSQEGEPVEQSLLLTKDSIWFTYAGLSQISEREFRVVEVAKIVDYKGVKRSFASVESTDMFLNFKIEGENVGGFAMSGVWGSGADVEDGGREEAYLVKVG